MDIIKHLQWRYATKKFNPGKEVSPKKLEIIKQAFNLTATSFGLQTLSLIIISDKNLKASLLEHSYNQKQVLNASHLLVLCIQEDILETDVVNYYENIKTLRNTPEDILKPFRESLIKTMQSKTIEERQQWSKNQAYIALGNLMTVCATLGVDACPMEGFSPTAYDSILELNKKGLKSVLLLPIGHRAKDDMFANFTKVRKNLSEVIIEI